MSTPGMIKSYRAEATIEANRIVKYGAADYGVVKGAAATDKLMGVTTDTIDHATGEMVDVIKTGIGLVLLGGTVTRGDWITSDATGQGVTAAPAAGVNNSSIGRAEISGVAGDVIPVHVQIEQIQG